jgi:hypothetical protein
MPEAAIDEERDPFEHEEKVWATSEGLHVPPPPTEATANEVSRNVHLG